MMNRDQDYRAGGPGGWCCAGDGKHTPECRYSDKNFAPTSQPPTPPTDATRSLRELIAEWRQLEEKEIEQDEGKSLMVRLAGVSLEVGVKAAYNKCREQIESLLPALESELAAREAAVREDVATMLEVNDRPAEAKWVRKSAAPGALERERLRARIEEAEWWELDAPDCGMPPSGNPDCIYCQRLADLRAKLASLVKP